MPLANDFIVDRIIKEIQAELKKVFDKDIPYKVVVKILEQQCLSTVRGMNEGHTITWKYFGNYVATKKRVDALNKQFIKRGRMPMLEDNGLIRLSFKKDGTAIGSTIIVGHRKADLSEQGDYIEKYKAEQHGTF